MPEHTGWGGSSCPGRRSAPGAQGALLGLALGFIVAGGGLVYSVTGHRPTNSDAWPTDLLVWGIALVLASVSGLAGGWIAGRARARRSD